MNIPTPTERFLEAFGRGNKTQLFLLQKVFSFFFPFFIFVQLITFWSICFAYVLLKPKKERKKSDTLSQKSTKKKSPKLCWFLPCGYECNACVGHSQTAESYLNADKLPLSLKSVMTVFPLTFKKRSFSFFPSIVLVFICLLAFGTEWNMETYLIWCYLTWQGGGVINNLCAGFLVYIIWQCLFLKQT